MLHETELATPFVAQIEQLTSSVGRNKQASLFIRHRVNQFMQEEAEMKSYLNNKVRVLFGLLIQIRINAVNKIVEHFAQHLLVGLMLLLLMSLYFAALRRLWGGRVDQALAKCALLSHELKYAHDGESNHVALFHTPQFFLPLVRALFYERKQLLDKFSYGLNVDAAKTPDNKLSKVVAFAFYEGHNHFEQRNSCAKCSIKF